MERNKEVIDDDLRENPNLIVPYIKLEEGSNFALQVKKMKKPRDKKNQSFVKLNETDLSFGKGDETKKIPKVGHKRQRTQTSIR